MPLRQRVAARRRGEDPGHDAQAERKTRQRWRALGYGLQAIGLFSLLAYAGVQIQQGFRMVDYRLVLIPSLVFVAGRVIQLWLSMDRRRR